MNENNIIFRAAMARYKKRDNNEIIAGIDAILSS